MSILTTIKNFFMKGGAQLGMTSSLTTITDDPRISIDPEEYERIRVAKNYYKDDFKKVRYRNSYGVVKERDLMSINVTRMASRRLASIIFNEKCSIMVDDDTANDLLIQILEDNEFYNQFEEKLESGIALGGLSIRPYVQDDQIKLAWVFADQFYPIHWTSNQIDQAAIASRTIRTENKQNTYYTLLEFHQWLDNGDYQITNELYRSTDSNAVGNRIPLSTLPEYANLQEQAILHGLTSPLFAYFRAPGTNNRQFDSPLGLGIVDNSKRIVDAINQTHDQFIWEVKMGQRKVAVPAEMMRRPVQFGNNGEQKIDTTRPPIFDEDSNVFVQMYGDDDIKITDLTSPIRNDQYQATMDFFLGEFENAIGISQGTFTATPSGIQTATEVVSNNSMTYQTRSSYLSQVEKCLNEMVKAIFELLQCGQLYNDGNTRWTGDIDDLVINIDFADGVYTDKTIQFTQDSQAVQLGVMPKKRFLMRNFGLDEQQAEQWLEEYDAEQPEYSSPFTVNETVTNPDDSTDDGAGAD